MFNGTQEGGVSRGFDLINHAITTYGSSSNATNNVAAAASAAVNQAWLQRNSELLRARLNNNNALASAGTPGSLLAGGRSLVALPGTTTQTTTSTSLGNVNGLASQPHATSVTSTPKPAASARVSNDASSSSAERNSNLSLFPRKLHDMLDWAAKEGLNCVSWIEQGKGFKVHDTDKFVELVLPKFFKQTRYKSFQRQLNLYGFIRIPDGTGKGGYRHKYFVKGERSICHLITRTSSGEHQQEGNGMAEEISQQRNETKKCINTTCSTSATAVALLDHAMAAGSAPVSASIGCSGSAPKTGDFPSSTDGTDLTTSRIPAVANHDPVDALNREFQFPFKLFAMLERSEKENFEHIVSWMPPDNTCFKVHNIDAFVEKLMSNYFKQTKYKSFQRQLNLYGFIRVEKGPNKGGYQHPCFIRGRKDLLSQMTRNKIKGATGRPASSPSIDETPTFLSSINNGMGDAAGLVGGTTSSFLSPNVLTTPNESIVAPLSALHYAGFYGLGTHQQHNSGISVILEAIKARERNTGAAGSAKEVGESIKVKDEDTNKIKVENGNRSSLTIPLSPDGLSWRQTPPESSSDWTIEVVRIDGTGNVLDSTAYHVHRHILSAGPIHSEFFSRLFKAASSDSSKKSELQLNSLQSSVFPLLLDHIYANVELELDTEKAYALYSLAEKLHIPSVLQKVIHFYQSCWDNENIVEFIKLGQSFRDKSLFDAAILKCAEELRYLSLDTAAKLDPEILYHVMVKSKTLPPELSCGSSRLSQLVAVCVSNATRITLTQEIFRRLTGNDMLPSIECIAAVKLLATENTLLSGSQGSPLVGDPSLHERCVLSIHRDWESLREVLDGSIELANTMRSISSNVLFDLLMKNRGPSNASGRSSSESEGREVAV